MDHLSVIDKCLASGWTALVKFCKSGGRNWIMEVTVK